MDIVFAINNKYIKYLYVTLQSLLESNSKKDIVVHVLSYDILEEDVEVLRRLVETNNQELKLWHIDDYEKYKPYAVNGYTVDTYLRLFLPWVITDVTKVLYLDCDILVKGDLSELFEVDLTDKAFAGCYDGMHYADRVTSRNDIFLRDKDYSYYNCGVMLWNLDYFRKKVDEKSLQEGLQKFGNRLYFVDQDMLNLYFYNDVITMDFEKFNLMSEQYSDDSVFESLFDKAVIIHFAGINPWKVGKKDRKDFKLWWHYAKRSPFYQDIVEDTLVNTAKNLDNDKRIHAVSDVYVEFKSKKGVLSNNEAIKNAGTIAVYGAGKWCRIFLSELGDDVKKVRYIFDKKNCEPVCSIEVISAESINKANEADILVITPSVFYEEIKAQIEGIVNIPMINVIDIFK